MINKISFLIFLSLVFNNISTFTIMPVLFLFIFVLLILKISTRANMKEFEQSLDNIGSVDILERSNSR